VHLADAGARLAVSPSQVRSGGDGDCCRRGLVRDGRRRALPNDGIGTWQQPDARGRTSGAGAAELRIARQDRQTAVVSVRVRSESSPQVLTDDGGLFPFEPFEGTPFERFFDRGDGSPSQNRSERAPRPSRQAQGSGFFISADGYIVTNNHVINKASTVEVVTR
jgi:S1-C subfamily serine protease